MASFENSLYRSISKYQENLLEEGKTFVGNWLNEQDDFEAAVDWLFSGEAVGVFENSKGTFAFDIVFYAIDAFGDYSSDDDSFEDSDEADEDEEKDDSGDDNSDKSEYYDRVRDFFNC